MSFEKRPLVSAVFQGTTALPISDGTLTLDRGRVPYCMASVEVPLLDASIVETLNPYANQRVTLTTSAAPDAADARSFNMVLTARTVSHDGRSVALELASDEAILQRYANVTDSVAAFTVQSSLRAVVNQVLAAAIPGTTLQTGPDANVTATTNSTNLIRNPRVANNATDWAVTWTSGGLSASRVTTGGPTYAPIYYAMGATSSTTGAYAYLDQGTISVTGNKEYALSVDVRSETGISVKIDAVIFDGSNNVIGYATPTTVTGAHPTWKRSGVRFTTPATAARVRPRVSVVGTLASGKFIDITAWRLSEGTEDTAADLTYFDGSTTNTTQYAYTWADTAHASTSNRTKISNAPDPDALVWKAGISAWDYLAPIVTMAGLKLWCDETRKWWLIDPTTYVVPGRVVAQVSNTARGTDTIDAVSGLYATGVVLAYEWTDSAGITRQATDTAGTGPYVIREELREAYPGPGRAATRLLKMQARGRTQDVTVGSDFTVTPSMEIGIRLPGTNEQLGSLASVTWQLKDGQMRLGSVGLSSTIPGTIDGLTGTIAALSVVIDSL